MTVQPDLHGDGVCTTIGDVIDRIPENRHHIYPTSITADGPRLHAPSYIAALWDGQLSVGTLCGSTSFTRITTEAKRAGYTECADCLRWLNHLEPTDG